MGNLKKDWVKTKLKTLTIKNKLDSVSEELAKQEANIKKLQEQVKENEEILKQRRNNWI